MDASMESVAKSPVRIAFGRFLLLPHRRELLADGQATGLGARAFDVLMALIEARGRIVGKDALAARVWPGQIIQDTALQSQVSALRAALGVDRDLIRTISGRGYQFVGEIRDDPPSRANGETEGAATPRPQADLPRSNLPEPVSELIGRDKELSEIEDLATTHRLVTLTGAGGIGKTLLAMTVARRLMPRFRNGAWVVDFSSVSDPSLVPATIAVAVGVDPGGTAPRQQVAQVLAVRRLLLVLDNCEHIVGAVAAMAEELLRAGTAAHVIATSREPLRAEGEWIYPVLPLAFPAEDPRDDDFDQYSAIRLFVERARAAEPHFAPDTQDKAAIAAICRRLDGLPLAIELAAARTASLSVKQLVAYLHDRFHLLTGGRRTALPRHQTLRATLDWSYELLSEPERVILRRLAIFSGKFSLEAATAVAVSPEIPPAQIIHILTDLAAKSLVVTEMGHNAHYRLLDTTRAYALEKLTEGGEGGLLARRHAEYYLALFKQAEAEWHTRPTPEWLADYGWKVDNLRAALIWAFSPEGDRALGIHLAASAAQLWLELSLLVECHAWTEKALAALDANDRGKRQEMVLQCAFGYSLMFTRSLSAPARQALQRVSDLADCLQDADYQLRALAGLASSCHRLEDFEGALAVGRRAEAVATRSGNPLDVSIASWILGTSLLFLGQYAEALTHAQKARLLTSSPELRRAHRARLGRDGFIAASCTIVLIHWCQGLGDQACQDVRDLLPEARQIHHPFSRCTGLAFCGCVVQLWLGDLDAVEQSIAELKDCAQRYNLSAFYAYGTGFEGQLAALREDLPVAERLLRSCVEGLRERQSDNYPAFLNTLALVLAKLGRCDEGLAMAEEVLRRIERTNTNPH
jgi:predicted ATPase/DNA-binding winged helix-turn-helix (wHTH) protein